MATDLKRSAPRAGYVCSACGVAAPKWQGRCPACEEWNSLGEQVVGVGRIRPVGRVETVSLGSVVAQPARRIPSGSVEVDRVLGGGLIPGSVVLLGGDPGIGKSTLALQVARHCGSGSSPALYCSGEESTAQLALRARRLGCDGDSVRLLVETDMDSVAGAIEAERPSMVVVDSVQTLRDPALPGAPGSPGQVRAAVLRMAEVAKASGVAVVLVGHVTKEGAIAGPRTLEHMVDVVLYLEGERLGDHRMLRGVKNRFGATGEVGLLTMEPGGMRDVEPGSRGLLDSASLQVPGSVLTIACEGLRPIAVEVQALTASSAFENPRRTASGFDQNRLHLLIAVLAKRAEISLDKHDVFVNTIGGIRLADPATDLAVAMAVAGAKRNRRLADRTAVVGELGLGGEVRRVSRTEARLAEAVTVGIEFAVVPSSFAGVAPSGIRCHRVSTINEALALLG